MLAMLFASVAPGGTAHAADNQPVLFQDNFASGSISAAWAINAGSYTIQDGALTATNANSAISAGESTWTDYAVESKVRLNNNGAYGGIMFRVQDINNNYWLRLFKPTSGTAKVELLKRVNNTPTILATYDYALSINVWYTLKVVVKGSLIQGYLNGAQIIETTDTQYASGKIGLRNLTQTMSADDVIVSGAASSSQMDMGASAQAFKLQDESAVNNINLTWEPGENVAVYTVLRGTSPDKIDTTIYEGAATFIDDYGLAASDSDAGTTYYYQVKGTSAFGSETYESRIASAAVYGGASALALYDNSNEAITKRTNETRGVAGQASSNEPGGIKVPNGSGGYDYYQYTYERMPVTLTIDGATQERNLFRGYSESKYNSVSDKFEPTGNVFLQPGRTRAAADAQTEHLYAVNDRYTDPVSLQYKSEAFADDSGAYSSLDFAKLEAVNIGYNEDTNSIILWGHYENPYNYSIAAAVSASWIPGDSTYASEWYSGAVRPYGHASRDISYFIDKNDPLEHGYAAYILFASNRTNEDGSDSGAGANHTMMIQPLNADYKTIAAARAVPILQGGYREAPHIINDNGLYYLFSSGAHGWLPSPTAYITAPSMLGPWTEMKFPGSATTFSGQSGHISEISGSDAKTYALNANRWWRTADAPGSRLFPLAINGDYANFDYYPNLYINNTTGVIVPERRGVNVAFGKRATSSLTGETNLAALTDQNYKSQWDSGSRGVFTVTIDLEQLYQLESMEINWGLVKGSESWYPFKIYASQNGTDYTLLHDGSTRPETPNVSDWGFDAPVLNNGESASTGRYVRLEVGATSKFGDGRGLSWTSSSINTRINEIRVMASPPGGEELPSGTKLPTSYDPVVVATYVGQQPAMPTSITGKAIDNSVVDDIYVDWELPADADYSRAFGDAIEVVGAAYLKVGAGQTRYELTEPVKAYIEVVPQHLKYFIDSGTVNPYIYNAVQQLTGNSLLNGSTNQLYDAASGWGYIALSSAGATKPIINKSEQPDLDKNATGSMIDGGDPLSTLSYRLDGLEGGKSYRFTSYHRLWWGNEMPIKISIDYNLNGQKVSQLVNRLHLDHAGHSRTVTYSVELPVGATDVRYVMTNAGSYTSGPGAGKTNKNAAISWLAVEELAGSLQPVAYSSIGGIAGANTDVWFDTNGVPIQAHGGQVIWVDHVAWNGNKPTYTANPGDGDGAWLWVGEDKTYGGRPIGGIHTYVSKDLYNWVDMGIALYPHRVFPMEKTADGQGVKLSDSQLEALKARAMGTAGTGTNELGQPVSQFGIEYARDFLQVYVDKNAHPDYSRDNDGSFNYATASYDEASLKLAFDRTYAYYTIMERPKMLYNDQTKQYVIVYHVDGPTDARILEFYDTLKNSPATVTAASRYSRAQMGFAVSDSPFGPFKLVNAQKMNYIDGYYDSNKGMARDMTVFKDDDGKAYAIYSSEENKYTYISLLNDEYTAPVKHGTEGLGETFTARVFTDTSREAPAVFKYNGYYYFITSGTTGWDPNPSIAYRANHIFGNTADGGKTFTPYTNLGNPFPHDSSNTSYRTQSTAIIPYDAENGLFIYMGDRWIQRALETSGYVWIPLQITAGGIKIEGQTVSDWSLDMLDTLAPLQVLATGEATFKLGEVPELPATLNLKQGATLYNNVPVSWNSSSVEAARLKLGTTVVQGTLGGNASIAGRTVEYEVTVTLPEHMLYFVNPATGEVPQYTAMVNEYIASTGAPLLHNAAEQNYDPQSGKTWGYVGSNSAVRNTTSDIFQSLRYVNNASNRNLSYKFDLGKGEYNVYIGFYDPWFSSSQSKRVANTAINGTTVETGRIINASYEIAEHQNIVMNEDGTMEIIVSPANSGSNTDVQLSWIIIAGANASVEPGVNKDALQLLYDEHKHKMNDNYTEASWNVFVNALAGALAALEDEAATQQQTDEALQVLSAAAAGLERKPAETSPLFLSGPASVVSDQVFEVKLVLNTVTESVYAHDFTVNYDPAKLVYAATQSLKTGFSIVDQSSSEPGQIRFLAVDLQPGAANASPIELLELQFRAKVLERDTAGSITLTDVVLANEAGEEKAATEPMSHNFDIAAVSKAALEAAIADALTLHGSAVEGNLAGQYPTGSKAVLWSAIQAAVTVKNNAAATQSQVDQALETLTEAVRTFEALAIPQLHGDLNGDGKIGIGDLAVIAAYYGRNNADSNWNAFKRADLNEDGVIDIKDLRGLAQLILA
jgi:hypothetical protein